MTTSLDFVVPVLNEEQALTGSIDELAEFLGASLPEYDWRIVIADNGSTDSTPDIACRLASEQPRISYVRLEQRGRGRALRKAWLESRADIVGYTDVDLSTDLAALVQMIKAVTEDGYDLAIGSRLRKGARVIGRPLKREVVSRVYSLLFRTMFGTGFRDAQCGFKVLTRRVAKEVVPMVVDTGWFFDSELLILAEKNGYRVKEVPVIWIDDSDSRVRILNTAYGDLKGLLRLRFGGLRRVSRLLSKRGTND